MGAELNNDKTPNQSTEQIFAVGQIVFGKFEVLTQLGAGNMGQVYKVRDINLDKNLALKVLHAHAREEKDILRFQNEAKTASRLNHPNIATVYDFGLSEDGSPYMAIEFIEGQTLESLMGKGRRMRSPEFLAIFADVAEALECAHRNGIIHRDVKPGNIMLVSDEGGFYQTKVLDFGLAKKIDATDTGAHQITTEGQLMGTPLYMSPEQTRGLPATAQSDLYSLGCVMYEALSGKTPFLGRHVIETLLFHQTKTPPSLKELVGRGIPDSIIAMVNRLLLKRPEERFESADQVLEVLIAHIEAQEGNERSAPQRAALEERTTHRGEWVLKKVQTDKRVLPFAILLLLTVAALPGWLLYKALQVPNEESKVVYHRDGIYSDGYGETKKRKTSKSAHPKNPQAEERVSNNPKMIRARLEQEMKSGATRFVPFFAGPISDDDLQVFENYQPVIEIDLWGLNSTSDRGLKHFSKLKNLKKLNLQQARVATLEGLRGMTSIEELGLQQTDVTDDAMSVVATLSNLRVLRLRDTKITTAGLQKLVKLPNLTAVQLSFPSRYISTESIRDFALKNPECRFVNSTDIWTQFRLDADKAILAGDFKSALSSYEILLRAAKRGTTSNGLMCSTLQTCGNCAYNVHNYSLAEKYFKEEISFATKCNACDLIKTAYYRLFQHYVLVKNFSAAETTLRKYFQVLKERGDEPEKRLIGMCWLAQNYKAVNQFSRSIYWWRQLLVCKELKGQQHADVQADYADTLRLSGDTALATTIFEKAIAEFRQELSKNPSLPRNSYFDTLFKFSANEWVQGKFDRGLELNEQALKLSQKDPKTLPIFLEAVLGQRIAFLTHYKKTGLGEVERYKSMYDKLVKARLATAKTTVPGNSKVAGKSGASSKLEATGKPATFVKTPASVDPTVTIGPAETGDAIVPLEEDQSLKSPVSSTPSATPEAVEPN